MASKERKSIFYPEHSQAPSDLEEYTSSCHCGTIQFTFLHPISSISVCICNCSICEINGYLNVYPFRSEVTWVTSPNVLERSLGVYTFNSKERHHKFCKDCGTSLLIDFEAAGVEKGGDYMAINVRTIKGIDLKGLKMVEGDGKHRL